MLGRNVAMLVNTAEEAGQHTVNWNAHQAASGMYFYKLDAAPVNNSSKRYTVTKKMLLVK
jgi:glucose/arabinose dehydrogenase